MDFLASLLAFSKSPSTLREFWARRRHRWASSRLDSISHTTLNHPSVAKVDFKEVQIFNPEELHTYIRHMSHNFFQAGWRVLNSLKLVRHWLLEENRILILIIGLWRLFPMAFPCVKSCLGSSSSGELWQQLKPFLQSGLQLQQRLAALQQWSRKPDSKKGLGCLGEAWAGLQKGGKRDVI